MWYVRLRYTWESDTTVEAQATTDWKKYRLVKNFDVAPWDIFLCEETKSKEYKYREYLADTYEDNEWTQDIIWHGQTEKINIENREKRNYYHTRANFATKGKALLHYLCTQQRDNVLQIQGRVVYICFSSLFKWILSEHQEYYYPKKKVESIYFIDVIKYLEEEGYIYYHRVDEDNWQITFLDTFFQIPTISNFIKEQRKEEKKRFYKIKKAEEIEKANTDKIWKNEYQDIESFQDISFNKNIIKIWKRKIDMDKTNNVLDIKDEFEKMSKKEYTNQSKFFIALRTLLAILIVWERSNRWEKIKFDIDATSFKEEYLKLWKLLDKFPIQNIWKGHANYITVTNNLLDLCTSKLEIPRKNKGQPYILSIKSLTSKSKK